MRPMQLTLLTAWSQYEFKWSKAMLLTALTSMFVTWFRAGQSMDKLDGFMKHSLNDIAEFLIVFKLTKTAHTLPINNKQISRSYHECIFTFPVQNYTLLPQT